MSEYAIVIDKGIEAVWLRDLCRREAQKHHDRAAKATQRAAVTENVMLHEAFAKYAERFEHIRKQERDRIAESMR